jgi:hypothetical protein
MVITANHPREFPKKSDQRKNAGCVVASVEPKKPKTETKNQKGKRLIPIKNIGFVF